METKLLELKSQVEAEFKRVSEQRDALLVDLYKLQGKHELLLLLVKEGENNTDGTEITT